MIELYFLKEKKYLTNGTKTKYFEVENNLEALQSILSRVKNKLDTLVYIEDFNLYAEAKIKLENDVKRYQPEQKISKSELLKDLKLILSGKNSYPIKCKTCSDLEGYMGKIIYICSNRHQALSIMEKTKCLAFTMDYLKTLAKLYKKDDFKGISKEIIRIFFDGEYIAS
jgi:hypothetical protein